MHDKRFTINSGVLELDENNIFKFNPIKDNVNDKELHLKEVETLLNKLYQENIELREAMKRMMIDMMGG